MKFLVMLLTIGTFSSVALGHIRMKSPTPRSSSDNLKRGPCGGVARSANPTVVMGGQALVVNWDETIDHPGRFLISLSMANDNFQSPPLKTVIDNLSGPGLHQFTSTVQIPNINCDTCTIQLIQSMEENPQAPTYYYSCADIKIVATAPTPNPEPNPQPNPQPQPMPGPQPMPAPQPVPQPEPVPAPFPAPAPTPGTGGDNSPSGTDGNNSTQKAPGTSVLPTSKFGGGCGSIGMQGPPNSGGAAGALVFLPFMIWLGLRLRAQSQLKLVRAIHKRPKF